MSQYVETNVRTFQASAAIAQHLRVYLTGGKLATAGAAQRDIGTMDAAALAADEYVGVRLRNCIGTVKMVAAGAVTAGSWVYGAAGGKVDDASVNGSAVIGIALTAATADGDVIEVFRDEINVDVQTETLATASPAAAVYGVSLIDSTANAVDATLASGLRVGVQKLFVMTEASNSSTLSVTNHVTSDPEVFTFDAVDEMLLLVWTGTEWETVKATATT